MAGDRFGDARLLHVAERQRDGFVAIGCFRLALHDGAGASFDHRHRDAAAVGREYARHPNLAADDVLHLVRCPLCMNGLAPVTPTCHGSWRFFRDSPGDGNNPRPAWTTTAREYQGRTKMSNTA